MPFAAFLVRKRLPPRVSLCTFWGWQTWCSTNLAMISRPDSGGNEKGGSNFLPTGEASASSKPSQTPTLSHWVNATQRSTPLQHTLAYQPSFLQTGTPGIHETHLSSPQHCSPPPPPAPISQPLPCSPHSPSAVTAHGGQADMQTPNPGHGPQMPWLTPTSLL